MFIKLSLFSLFFAHASTCSPLIACNTRREGRANVQALPSSRGDPWETVKFESYGDVYLKIRYRGLIFSTKYGPVLHASLRSIASTSSGVTFSSSAGTLSISSSQRSLTSELGTRNNLPHFASVSRPLPLSSSIKSRTISQ